MQHRIARMQGAWRRRLRGAFTRDRLQSAQAPVAHRLLLPAAAVRRLRGRSRAIRLYAIRYRGEALMLLARGVPISGTVQVPTTEISVPGTQGQLAASGAAAELLALLARELPAEIESVKARFADEKAARASARPQKKRPGRGR